MTRHLTGCGPRAARTPSVPGALLPVGKSSIGLAVLLALAAFSPTGCRSGSPGPHESDPRLPTYSARGPVCAAESYPERLPRVNAVVDSSRLATAASPLRGAPDSPAEGYVLLSLEFDENGVLSRRDVLEHSTSAAVADSIWRLVGDLRREVDESERAWGVRLRVEIAAPGAVSLGRREFCRPVARNRDLERQMQRYAQPGTRVRGRVREETVHMRAFVSDLGTITDATILRGGLPGSSLERSVFLFLQQFLFEPATIDGEATGAWIEIPVHVRMPA